MPTTTTDRKEGATPPDGRLPRRLGLIGIAVAVLMLGAAGYVWLSGSGGDGSGIGGPFTLTGGDGKPVASRDFRGRYMLIYFGYTYCPDVCPTTLNEVAAAMDRLGAKADQVQPIFVTIDPRRDTPAAMKTYAANFTPRLIGLTGTPDQIAKVAGEYRVYYQEHRTGPGPDDYTMDHSSILYLMGPDGNFVAPVRADESGQQMAADISKHLN